NLGEAISYDVMGNITSLTRDGFGTNNYTGYNGNRLTAISGFTNSSYGYDANGNLTSDTQKNITLSYNFLNQPYVVGGSQNLNYTYSAVGEKLKKQNGSTITEYARGIQYSNGSIDFIQTEEGLARRNGSSYSYEYNLGDHLGNVRTTFYKNPNTNQLEILQRDDYYAFGLRKKALAGASNNKYLYNGKELQEELEQYDYGARLYDPVIGRFNVVDRFAEKYSSTSSYGYSANNPINLIDINGDSLWVSYAGNKILYNNGSFYNSDGSAYTGRGVKTDKNGNVTGYKGFLGQVFNALNSIGGTDEGNGLLNELQTSSNNYTIQNSTTNDFVVNPAQRVAGYANQLKTDPQYANQLATTAASEMLGGAGGTINWNPNGASVWVLGKEQNNNPTSNLGHELFHGLDANRGLLDNRTSQGLKYDEWQATYRENLLRFQMGLPVREYYKSKIDNDVSSPVDPKVLDKNNQGIKPTWVPNNW
ncbi:RHS repeat-associated protein, partial [Pedobacter sp. AK013]|uniref:M91 family zinc metallopeptidase n=1 Tax=Pedobacter sp. AK013 TaxID=2723071 RepID=UPI0017A327E6